jgi:hypothetical protein
MKSKDMKPKFLFYNATDDVGSDGDWVECQTFAGGQRIIRRSLRAMGFSSMDIPDSYRSIELDQIQSLTDKDFAELLSEWGLARKSGWVTDSVDGSILREALRRAADEWPEHEIGKSAKRALAEPPPARPIGSDSQGAGGITGNL